MRKNDLIKKLDEIPGNPIVVIMDNRINEHFASGEGTSEGIENAFDVSSFVPVDPMDPDKQGEQVISLEFESDLLTHQCQILNSHGMDAIYTERERQIEKEGWTPEHDDKHDNGELARAAAVYALCDLLRDAANKFQTERNELNGFWPFGDDWFKPTPKDRVKELTKAGALIAAEIDRLKRKQGRG